MSSFFFEIIKFHQVSKNYGPKQVLRDVSFSFSRGEHVALIGENGSGKTTIVRLITKQVSGDQGEVWVSPDCTIGYLPQNVDDVADGDVTIEDFLLEAQGGLQTIAQRLRELEEAMSCHEEKGAALAEWDRLYQLFTQKNGYEALERAQACLKALQIDHLPNERTLTQLSEGERRRIFLAGILLQQPDVLILDEPTNHLDHKALEWLEGYLHQFNGTLLLISHDRTFINRTAMRTMEILGGTVSLYPCNYDTYLETKEKEKEHRLKEYEEQKAEKRHLKMFLAAQTFAPRKVSTPKDRNIMAYDYRGERFGNAKRKKITQAKSRLEKLGEEQKPHPLPKGYRAISFQPVINSEGPFSLRLEEIGLDIGEKTLMRQFSALARPGDRIILSGPNGCGKSTLLRLLAARGQPRYGRIEYAGGSDLSFLPQDATFHNEQLTLLEYFQFQFGLLETEIRSRLHCFALIEDRFIGQRIATLSLGQKRRLQLLEIMLQGANFLLLDEPTNHLALPLVDQLEEALLQFPGTVIAATHDRRFAERIGTSHWHWD